jgi:hypothetical protein
MDWQKMPDSSFDHDATALVMGIFWSVGDVCIFLLIMRSVIPQGNSTCEPLNR